MKNIFVALSILWMMALVSRIADASDDYSPAYQAYVGADDFGGVKYPYFKMVTGIAGVAIPVSASNPLPVNCITGCSGGGGGGGNVTVLPNTNGSVSNNSSVNGTASTFTAPGNSVGFILECESGNTNNVRWAAGSVASATVGTLCEPGRDTGFIPMSKNISVISIGGTQSVSVQWVLSI